MRLDADIFQERYGVPKPTQDSDVIFHCRAGVRSLVAIDTANKLGYSRFVIMLVAVLRSSKSMEYFLASKFGVGRQPTSVAI